jgi:hypothetical protein
MNSLVTRHSGLSTDSAGNSCCASAGILPKRTGTTVSGLSVTKSLSDEYDLFDMMYICETGGSIYPQLIGSIDTHQTATVKKGGERCMSWTSLGPKH